MTISPEAAQQAARRFGGVGLAVVALGFATFLVLQRLHVVWAPACAFAGLAAASYLGVGVFWRLARGTPHPADVVFVAGWALLGGAFTTFTALVFVVPTGAMPRGAAAWVLTGAALGLGLLALALLSVSIVWALRRATPGSE